MRPKLSLATRFLSAMALATVMGATGVLAEDWDDDLFPPSADSIIESRATIDEDEDLYFEEDLRDYPVDEDEELTDEELLELAGDPQVVDGQGHRCVAEEDEPQLADRCYERVIVMSDDLVDVEEQVKEWIATCVMSRTIVNGKPIRREVGLVEDNPSLVTLWATYGADEEDLDLDADEEDEIVFEEILLEADYCFENGGVRSIDFFTNSL